MALTDKPSRRIAILRESVLRKIAAGEVITRPFSVIRELLDNSIDAGSTEVTVTVEGGGTDGIRVVDNGCGMDEEDLNLCTLPHATSKITDDEDLYRITTLGFRGEALASIAHCSLLDVTSAVDAGGTGFRIEVRDGKILNCAPHRSNKGTAVQVRDIFHNMPARKKFLKRASAEGALCYGTFTEKTLPFPGIAFKYFSDGAMKGFFPQSDLKSRMATVFRQVAEPRSLTETGIDYPDFSIKAVAGTPDLMMRDRKHIQIYVNNRRIAEYGLVQAVEYGYSGLIPGKNFPFAIVFITVKPEFVDFNIHPAKKECRFRNMPEIHQAVVTLFKKEFGRFGITLPLTPLETQPSQSGLDFSDYEKTTDASHIASHIASHSLTGTVNRQNFLETVESRKIAKKPAPEENLTEYIGKVFGLFLLVRRQDSLFLIDQHAAHERLLYERFKSNPSPPQELLFPIAFEIDPDEESLFERNAGTFKRLGISIEKNAKGQFEILTLPADFHSLPASVVVDFIRQAGGTDQELEKNLYSMAACKLAIKDGDDIDGLTARTIAEGVFTLENPRCPHGRKIFIEMTKSQLLRSVDRI